MRLAEALQLIDQTFRPVSGTEMVRSDASRSRILAVDILAPASLPAADNSAVDGYAFRHGDLDPDGRTAFRVVGRAAAGHPFKGRLCAGEAVRIFTGALIPETADTVAMQEHVEVTGDLAIIPAAALGDNRRRAGEDIREGAKAIAAGCRLGPAEIGMLAALGIDRVTVRAPLRVALFSTGDELIEAGGLPVAGRIYDTNRPMLRALLRGLGMEIEDHGILPDSRQAIRSLLAEAAIGHDAVICSAGMSVGDEDHVRAALQSLGTLDIWNVAIKPGRPIAAGKIGQVPFFGLPGNPAAMLVTFLTIIRPALCRLAGVEQVAPRRFPVVADFSMERKPGRREFLICTLHDTPGGGLVARRTPRHGSGMISPLVDGEGLLEIDEDELRIVPGMVLPFTPFSGLGL